jgi:hypothetical protein
MKKKNLFIASFLFGAISVNQLNAQVTYLELTTGYALPLAPQAMAYNYTSNSSDVAYTYKDEVINGSYGKGLNVGLKFGYMFNTNLGLELQGDYHLSAKYEGESKSNQNYSWNTFSSVNNRSTYATMIRLTPTLVFEVPGKLFTPYARIGVVLGMGKITGEETYSNSDGETGELAYEMNGGLAVGSSAEIGLKFGLTEKLSFTTGIKAIGMNYAPKRGEITKYTENGVDILSDLTTSEREVEFVDEYSGSSASSNPDEPGKDLKTFSPFSSIGLSVGFRYSF